MQEKIIEKIGQVARGEIAVGDLPGSTTERMAIGLRSTHWSTRTPALPEMRKEPGGVSTHLSVKSFGHSIPPIARRNGQNWRG